MIIEIPLLPLFMLALPLDAEHAPYFLLDSVGRGGQRDDEPKNSNIEALWAKIPNPKSQIPNNLQPPMTQKTNKKGLFS